MGCWRNFWTAPNEGNLQDAYRNVINHLELSRKEDFFFGAKIVRGAYIKQVNFFFFLKISLTKASSSSPTLSLVVFSQGTRPRSRLGIHGSHAARSRKHHRHVWKGRGHRAGGSQGPRNRATKSGHHVRKIGPFFHWIFINAHFSFPRMATHNEDTVKYTVQKWVRRDPLQGFEKNFEKKISKMFLEKLFGKFF